MRTLVVVLVLTLGGLAVAEEAEAPRTLIEGRTFRDTAGEALRLENEEDVVVRGCRFENVGVAIRLVNCRRITIQSCAIRDVSILAIDVRGGCTDIRILDNVLTGFRDDVQGGHLISTEKTDTPRQHRITISGNTLRGNGTSFVPGKKTGAVGDMIALRSVAGFTIRGNDLAGGGEFGMTCIHGSRDGVIANNRIRDVDGTGLLIAYGVKNVNVVGNNIIDCGMSFETDGSKNDITHQAGIHCRGGIRNVLITSNLIVRERAPEMRYGIHLRETSGTIRNNRIVGVDEAIHVPQSLLDTVTIE